jgi:hypothetical protein
MMKRLNIIPLAVLAVTPCATVTAQDLPVVDVVVSSGIGAVVGTVFGLIGDANAAGVTPLTAEGGASDPDSPCFRNSCALLGAALGATAGAVVPVASWAERRGVNPILVRGTAGLLLGAVTGVGIGLFAEDRDASAIQRGEEPTSNCDEIDCVRFGAVAVGVLGAAVGVVWGIVRSRKRASAESDRMPLSVVMQHDGRLGLGLSVRF